MSKTIKSDIYEYLGRLWKVNSKESGLRTNILRCLLGQFHYMLGRHRKVFVCRFDLSVHYYTETNELMAMLFRRLSRRIKIYYGTDLTYCWVREHKPSTEAQHYHCCVFLNGSKVNQPYILQWLLKMIWSPYFGRCHWAGYHNLDRHNQLELQDATFHVSYLAKTRTKGYRAPQTKDYGHSRIT